MKSPYGLDIIESCLSCTMRQDYLFCNLQPASLKTLDAIKTTASYPKGALLFVEGQLPRGIFIVCGGRAKLTTTSKEGKSIIIRIAEAGEVLGLSASVSGKPYEVTAELLEPTQANFIRRQDFLDFLQKHGDAALRVAQELSRNYHSAYEEIRSLGLSRSATEKLVKLLLEWDDHGGKGSANGKINVSLTHEELAQLIGSSRETVTRIFADLKKRKLITVKGSSISLKDHDALARMVSS
ncbi:MAG: Crp/Fnr family transcriptional regulator [Candidatus Koribacter versatilis]|uniref:Crp/Fnr family transcriptional regulator n=1 Tax=Candidatus Korobacter versatilis TaxID=658062 RepID=A0A932A6P3_9BACT|nr:Crp/Fnr family transcriptional regulator [Candidatus Koribacter versatilis]